VSVVKINAITVPRERFAGVVTRWRSEDNFRAWMASQDFAVGHAQHRQSGPVGTASELWSFDVLERKDA
jgi:heme-degrading monooxygenase HmoA